MGSEKIFLVHKIGKDGENIFLVNDKAYLDVIIELYPEHKDKAIENYMKMVENKNKKGKTRNEFFKL